MRLGIGWAHIDVLPVRVQRLRHPIALDPAPQHRHRRPDRFLRREPGHGRGRGVIDHVHQTAARPTPFQPLVKASVQLHQLAEVCLGFASLPIRFPSPLPLPASRLFQPPPQRLGVHLQAVIARQVLTRQRWAEVLITGLYLLQHRSSKLCPVCPVRHPPTVAVLQRLGSSCPIPRPDPLALPITQPQHLCRFAQSQATRLHSPHYFHSAQFLPAQSRSPQSRFLLAEGTLKGTLLMWSQGDTFNVVQH
jgi:hypothetical protein